MEPKLPRRERERLRHRQEILEAARRVVDARGIDGLTVDLVAREAEFAVGSIYRHFSSKEDLVEVLVGEFADAMFQEMEEIARSAEPFQVQFDRLLRTLHERRVEALPLFRAFLAAPGNLPSFDAAAGERMRGLLARYCAAIDAVLAVGQAEGQLVPGDRLPMVLAVSGLTDSYTKWLLFGPTVLQADVPTLVRRAFLDGFGSRS